MKPTELQIGDWVLIDNTPRQVVQLTKSKVGYHTEPNECRMHYARYADVEPIRITAEILEKNGFVKDFYYYNLDEEDGGYLQYYPHEWRLDRWYKDDILFRCMCHDVHQLQQAIRLCGIDKKIEV